MNVRWIFIHTAAHRGGAGAAEIDRWHRERGWAGIGYHAVIRRDGTVESGREPSRPGAHVFGANGRSLGVCCEGHGDHERHTAEQRAALLELLRDWMRLHTVPVERVLGHREVNQLVDAGELPERLDGQPVRTTKTCPGRLVSMAEIREQLALPHALPDPELRMVDLMAPHRRLRSS